MLSPLKIIIAPLLGGVIGYITNDLAIKMLFRPRKAVYLGKFHIPFTPGLIPQQKQRIAASVGSVISSQLLNPETLEQAFLSDTIMTALREKLLETIHSLGEDDHSLREKLLAYAPEEKVQYFEEKLKTKGSEMIVEKLLAADIGGTIVEKAVLSLKEKKKFALFAGFLDDDTVKAEIGGRINRVLESKGTEIIAREIERTEQDFMNRKLSDLYEEYQDKAAPLIDGLLNLYQNIVGGNLERALHMLNIQQIVVNKINEFSAEELENMIFSIMKKELKAIVYLGAMLGFLMGFINLLF